MVHNDGIARELTKLGYNVDVIINNVSLKDPQFIDLPYKIYELGGNTYSFFGQLRFIYNLQRHIKKREYDVRL